MEALIHKADELHSIFVDSSRRVTLPVDNPANGIHTDSVEMKFREPVVGGGL